MHYKHPKYRFEDHMFKRVYPGLNALVCVATLQSMITSK